MWSLGADCCLTAHNNHKRQASMSQRNSKPAIPLIERLQTHTLDRPTVRIGLMNQYSNEIITQPTPVQ